MTEHFNDAFFLSYCNEQKQIKSIQKKKNNLKNSIWDKIEQKLNL